MSTLPIDSHFARLSTSSRYKLVFLFLAAIIFGSNLHAFFGWNERVGVHDSICYLRQAHLFQRFGLNGIDTNITRDDDGFFMRAQRQIGLPVDQDPSIAVCHPMSTAGKRVLQYPPGTGFIMAAFPEGSQVAWLYTSSMLVVMGAVMFVVGIASIRASIMIAGLFGLAALYFMVNPTKASYSMAPTTVACILAALLTPALFMTRRQSIKIGTAAAIGLLLGLSVSFRTANVLLVAGYAVVLAVQFLRTRNNETFLTGFAFAAAYLVGLAPSLIANYVNAGGPLTTTYAAHDAAPPDLTFSIMAQYLTDMQLYLVILAAGAAIWMFRQSRYTAAIAVTAINLAVNCGFFFTHPIATQYYMMPIITLALWALLAQWLYENRYIRAS